MPSSRLAPLAVPVLLAGLALSACPGGTGGNATLHVPSPASWGDQVIYFVMTDRFANGDRTNDDQGKGEFDPTSEKKYSGGDLQGIIDHLDYIQGLGATAVWITPPVANQWWDPEQNFGGYHGYWARNPRKVDEHLGTLETYQALSRALHARGMYLIQDIVPNHMGNFFSYLSCNDAGVCASAYPAACNADYLASSCDVTQGVHRVAAVPGGPDLSPFDLDDPTNPAHRDAGIYHWTPAITDYNSPYQQWFWALGDLDDLNSENPAVRTALRDAYGYWIKEVGVDGFRVDTAWYVPHDFWNDFFYSTDPAAPGIMNVAAATGRTNFHAFGEIAATSDRLSDWAETHMAPYYGTTQKPEFPALLGYPLFGEIRGVLAQGMPTSDLTYRLQKFMDPALNPTPYLTPTFLDNHDQGRFKSSSNTNALIQGLTLLFSLPGIPTIYYGDEQGFAVTRQAMFDGGWASTGDGFRPNIGLYKIVKSLADMRKAHPVLTRGTVEVLYDNPTTSGAFVFRRKYQDDTALVFLNTSEKATVVANMATGLTPGTVLEKWTGQAGTAPTPVPLVDAAGKVTMRLEPREALVVHATSTVNTPGQAAATITVTTPLEGQTFTADLVVSGTVSPAGTALKMVLDGNLEGATAVTVNTDGSWSTTLPVSQFPVGRQPHSLVFFAPDQSVASPVYHLTTDVAFVGNTQSVDDPDGDDHGPTGKTYRYPSDITFGHQQDLLNVTALVGATTMKLQLTMKDVTTSWSPDQGFDHVIFDVFFSVPGGANPATVLPYLNASFPGGGTWNFGSYISGYKADNRTFTSEGATAGGLGTNALITGPKISVAGKTVTLEYDRNLFNLTTWTGTKVYVTTWDYDGVQKIFRPISAAGGLYEYSGGVAGDPKIMDDHEPITLQGP